MASPRAFLSNNGRRGCSTQALETERKAYTAPKRARAKGDTARTRVCGACGRFASLLPLRADEYFLHRHTVTHHHWFGCVQRTTLQRRTKGAGCLPAMMPPCGNVEGAGAQEAATRFLVRHPSPGAIVHLAIGSFSFCYTSSLASRDNQH